MTTRHLVLGLGGTVDYEIEWSSQVFDDLVREYRIRRLELSTTQPITDERSLVVAILGFVAAGSGGERFAADSAVLEQFAHRFTTQITLGGTGVRAGLALAQLDIPSVQHLVSIDDHVRRLLPTQISTVCSATADSTDPHLIVQYAVGATVRLSDDEIIAPSSNRVIIANDPPNRNMVIASELSAELASASAFLISGFNTMDDRSALISRLRDLTAAMTALPRDAVVYYEDAGFYHREFSYDVRAALLPRIDVYGLNEDELEEYVGHRVALLDPQEVISALGAIRRLIPAPAVVVHTKYWAIVVGPEATGYRRSVEQAVDLAATRYRLGDAISASDVAETARMPRHLGGTRVVSRVEDAIPGAIGVAAHAISIDKPTTIGLGDTFVGGFLAPFAGTGWPR